MIREPEDDHSQHEYELVMPFVTVTSVGGPHDDDAYVAGWEMGDLDASLRVLSRFGVEIHKTIRADNRAQADLIAMKHGMQADFRKTDVVQDGVLPDEWLFVIFRPAPEMPA